MINTNQLILTFILTVLLTVILTTILKFILTVILKVILTVICNIEDNLSYIVKDKSALFPAINKMIYFVSYLAYDFRWLIIKNRRLRGEKG